MKTFKNAVIGILGSLILIILANGFRRSLFLKNPERINFVIYGKSPVFYSVGIKDKTNYRILFYPDLKIVVPGGYGNYRVGAIGKLAQLEKKPIIFKKTFSSAVFTFVDYYFYPSKEGIYYGKDNINNEKLGFLTFFSSKSNAGFFDKIYLSMIMYSSRRSDFKILELTTTSLQEKDEYLSADDFYKKSLGYFYKSSYRREKRNVQLIYSNSYDTALNISRIIEGNGIRVVDISMNKIDDKNNCQVIEKADKFSQTAVDLSIFFSCQLIKGEPDVSDIIIKLGRAEKDWEIN